MAYGDEKPKRRGPFHVRKIIPSVLKKLQARVAVHHAAEQKRTRVRHNKIPDTKPTDSAPG